MEHAEINKLREQFITGQFPRFINSIKISGLRSWNGEHIEFKFPIVAIAGENGTGKSTIIKGAACAYEGTKKATTYYPSDFFKETPWEKISNARMEYNIRQGNNNIDFFFSKPSERWRNNKTRPKNDVYILEISRTLPLDATAGYAKMAKQATTEISRNEITNEYRQRLSYILSKEYSSASFALTDIDSRKEVGILSNNGKEISQYHQGAGEDATLDLIRILQDLPNYALLIIDEVEASLHPKSQRRLIRFLLWFCRQKKCQIILTTHSPYIFQELPREARILLLPGVEGTNVVTGVSPEFAMSKLDDIDYPELNIFVEDNESEIWLREIIASHVEADVILSRIKTSSVGPSNVVQMMGKLGCERRLPYKSIAVIDGDKDPTRYCFKLPGDYAPEIKVMNDLKAVNWANLPERFGIGAGTLFNILNDSMLNPEHHVWLTNIGDKTRKSSKSVWEILTNEWCKVCLSNEEKNDIINKIKEQL